MSGSRASRSRSRSSASSRRRRRRNLAVSRPAGLRRRYHVQREQGETSQQMVVGNQPAYEVRLREAAKTCGAKLQQDVGRAVQCQRESKKHVSHRSVPARLDVDAPLRGVSCCVARSPRTAPPGRARAELARECDAHRTTPGPPLRQHSSLHLLTFVEPMRSQGAALSQVKVATPDAASIGVAQRFALRMPPAPDKVLAAILRYDPMMPGMSEEAAG
jgi:hypothetical protein